MVSSILSIFIAMLVNNKMMLSCCNAVSIDMKDIIVDMQLIKLDGNTILPSIRFFLFTGFR